MATEIKKVKGSIILKEKNYNRLIERKVYSNNKSSGKIIVPKPLINKKVYVLWLEEDKK
jgi:putative transposon-encoded protein